MNEWTRKCQGGAASTLPAYTVLLPVGWLHLRRSATMTHHLHHPLKSHTSCATTLPLPKKRLTQHSCAWLWQGWLLEMTAGIGTDLWSLWRNYQNCRPGLPGWHSARLELQRRERDGVKESQKVRRQGKQKGGHRGGQCVGGRMQKRVFQSKSPQET